MERTEHDRTDGDRPRDADVAASVSAATEVGRAAHPKVEFYEQRARWYLDGCGGLEDAKEYATSGDLAKDAAADILALCSRVRDLENAAQPERMFPIMNGPAIPWSVIGRCEHQAQINHNQSIKCLAERGGLDAMEAIAVLNGRDKWPGKLPSNEHAIRMMLAIVKERLELQSTAR